ncbi:MAG: DegQ family serine endoprotease [Myxococcales bacterium]
MTASALVLAAVLAAPSAPTPGRARMWTDAPQAPRLATPPLIPALLKTALPAIVGIVATTARAGSPSDDPFHDFLEKMYGAGGDRESEPVRGIGTGFFIRSDGLIATNNHVIEGATDLAVQSVEGGRVYRAVVVGKDDATDLALIKIEGDPPFPVLPLGDSNAAEVGEWVVAIGNPFGLSRSVTTGIISYKGRRDVNPQGKAGYSNFIQTDAAINPGNSGGPLLDARGAVIAINAAVSQAGQGIGFAVPINMLKELAPQLEARGRVVRGWIGLSIQEELTPELADSFGVPGGRGVLVTDVAPGGPAATAGLRRGDVVTAFEGEPVSESWMLRWLTAIAAPGRTVRLSFLREGAPSSVQVAVADKPGERPRQAPAGPAPRPPADEVGPFGVALEDRRPDELQAVPHGVRVGSTDVRGSAFRAGIREGDLVLELDGKPVEDRASFQRAFTASEGRVTRLFVRRGSRVLFFGLRRDHLREGRAASALPGHGAAAR